VSRDLQAGGSSRALLAAFLLAAPVLLGAWQLSNRLAPLGPAEHVLANRPPVVPTLTCDVAESALAVASRIVPTPPTAHRVVLFPAAELKTWLGQFSQYIRPPPFA